MNITRNGALITMTMTDDECQLIYEMLDLGTSTAVAGGDKFQMEMLSMRTSFEMQTEDWDGADI